METVGLIVVVGVCLLVGLGNMYLIWRSKKSTIIHNSPPTQVNVNLKPLQDAIDSLPNKVLQSITSSANTHKGALGELIGYVRLHSTYDRIIPLGDIADFLCVKLPHGEIEGHIDFLDIKTGKARLSSEQRELRKLIEEKKVNFVKLSIQTHNPDDC